MTGRVFIRRQGLVLAEASIGNFSQIVLKAGLYWKQQ